MTKGPHTMTKDELMELPEGVYYSAETDNFYLQGPNVGMGWSFWMKWRDRKLEFPARASLTEE